MKTLRMLSAQPALDYYAWQIEVCIHNFASLGYKNIDIVAGYQDEIPESWNKLYQTYSDIARFFFYKDTMGECNYPPAIQAHLLQIQNNFGNIFYYTFDCRKFVICTLYTNR